jgi:hypothetical protein
MKTLLTAALSLSLVATPAVAQDYDLSLSDEQRVFEAAKIACPIVDSTTKTGSEFTGLIKDAAAQRGFSRLQTILLMQFCAVYLQGKIDYMRESR